MLLCLKSAVNWSLETLTDTVINVIITYWAEEKLFCDNFNTVYSLFAIVLIFSKSQHVVEKLRNIGMKQGKDSYKKKSKCVLILWFTVFLVWRLRFSRFNLDKIWPVHVLSWAENVGALVKVTGITSR